MRINAPICGPRGWLVDWFIAACGYYGFDQQSNNWRDFDSCNITLMEHLKPITTFGEVVKSFIMGTVTTLSSVWPHRVMEPGRLTLGLFLGTGLSRSQATMQADSTSTPICPQAIGAIIPAPLH